MRFAIKHEIPGRIRFDLQGKIPEHDAIALEETFLALPCVTKCVAYPKAGSLSVAFEGVGKAELALARTTIVSKLKALTYKEVKAWEPENSLMLAPRPRHLFTQIANMIVFRAMRRWFLPVPLRTAWTIISAIPFWKAALDSLRHGRLDVPVLDGAAIAMGFIQGKPATAGSTIFLLKVGEILEDYTQRRSESNLVRSLLDIPTTATVVEGDVEREVAIGELKHGDTVVVRLGCQIPADGEVISGEAGVNQSSLTGEPLAIVRKKGDTVYAGTTMEEGEIFVRISGNPEESKLRSIVSMVEQSEALKSSDQKHIEAMADKLVPWNFLLAGIVALTTRNLTKTAAALMVDYSCALRLSGSIAVMAAQSESAKRGFTVKGSRYFKHMAEADVIVFDKTGTLTQATPSVREVTSYNEMPAEEVLRLAACLEEHFPHPVARAVVNEAMKRGLEHRERHADVEYVVAHGIASSINGKRCVIGSEHFVVEDEHVAIAPEELEAIHKKACGTSPLFLAVDNVLWGVLYIEDPLKENVAEVVEELKEVGFKRVIMLTGDNERSARRIAAKTGISEFKADLLPEHKHEIVEQLQAEGHRVVMVGDGVNDSPALAAAHVSIAMSSGSAVAREAADISLVSDDLHSLVELRKLSCILEKRMAQGYRVTIGFNTLLLALGIGGIITPQASSLLHNSATVGISAYNARAFLPEPTEED